MLLLLLQSLCGGLVESPALVAALSQQVVSALNQAVGSSSSSSGCADLPLPPTLLQALLLALAATVHSVAAEPSSVEMHARVWQHAQDALQVS
jgi:hypothetical protein